MLEGRSDESLPVELGGRIRERESKGDLLGGPGAVAVQLVGKLLERLSLSLDRRGSEALGHTKEAPA